MEDLLRTFRLHLGNRRFDKLEDSWLAIAEASLPDDQVFEIIELTERYGPSGMAEKFLWLLADARRERNDAPGLLVVLRHLVGKTQNETQLGRELASALRRVHSDVADLERILRKSGLDYGQPLQSAVQRFDRYIGLLPGARVLDQELGAGQVRSLDLLLDRVTVSFDSGRELTLEVDAASRRLRKLEKTGFHTRLDTDRAELVALAHDAPGELVRLYLKDTGQRSTVAELRAALEPLVAPTPWDTFWTSARRSLDKDPHIVVHARPARSYSYSPTGSHRPAAGKPRTTRQAVDLPTGQELTQMTINQVVTIYQRLPGFAEARRLIGLLQAARPDDWPEIGAALFAVSADRRARTLLERELVEVRPDLLAAAVNGALTEYRRNPTAFIWLAENADRLEFEGGPAAILWRMLDLLESSTYRGHWTALRRILAEDDYALLRASLKAMTAEDGARLVGRVKRARGVEPYRRDEVTDIAAEVFPELKPKADDVIHSSKAGIQKARDELNRQVNIELPATAEEIARARAHGDLSENYEYKAAKEKQTRLMGQINALKSDLAKARPIDMASLDPAEVQPGCRVTLEDSNGANVVYTVLGPWDSDPDKGIISYLAPLGQELVGKHTGDSLMLHDRLHTVVTIDRADIT